MHFNLNDDEQFDDADTATVREGLARMEMDDFAILSSADEVYVQCFYEGDNYFVLEYREGSYLTHFAADSEEVRLCDVQDAFVGFLEGDSSWKERWNWERIEFDEDYAGD